MLSSQRHILFLELFLEQFILKYIEQGEEKHVNSNC